MTALTVIVTMDPDNNWSHSVYSLPIDVLQAQIKTALSTGVDAHQDRHVEHRRSH